MWETSGSVRVVIGIKIDYGRTLEAELSLWRPQIVEESGQKYLRSKKETSSEVREVKNLCLCGTDESRFYVVPQSEGSRSRFGSRTLYLLRLCKTQKMGTEKL